MASRYDERNERESRNYGGRSESDYGRSWGGRAQGSYRYGERDRETGQSNRQNYGSYGRSGWESERDDYEDRDDRYGSYSGGSGRGSRDQYNTYGRSSDEQYGGAGYGRGYGESSSGSSQRYNYPTGFRSSRNEDEYSRNYDRGDYGNRERYGRGDEGLYSRGQSGSYGSNYGSGSYGSNYGSGERYGRGEESSRYGRDEDRWGRYDRGTGERGWWDRASDTVASWFGDEEAERRRQMDQQREHRGRGPKGYKRSDERIKEDVNDRLTDDYYLDASEIDVQVNSGEVILTGSVNNRSDKRRAEDIAESVSGVSNVENRLRVQASSSQATYGSSGTSSSIGTTTGSTSAATSNSAIAAGAGTGSSTAGKGRTSGT